MTVAGGDEQTDGVLRWVQAHPYATSTLQGLVVAAYGFRLFGDPRPAILGFVGTAILSYQWRRPGGFGERMLVEDAQEVAVRGGEQVRPAWLLRATIWVVAITVVLFLLMWLLTAMTT